MLHVGGELEPCRLRSVHTASDTEMCGIPCMGPDPRATSLLGPKGLNLNAEPDLSPKLAMTMVAMAQWREPVTLRKTSSKPLIVLLGLRSLPLLGQIFGVRAAGLVMRGTRDCI